MGVGMDTVQPQLYYTLMMNSIKTMKKNVISAALVTELTAAFDTVDHDIINSQTQPLWNKKL